MLVDLSINILASIIFLLIGYTINFIKKYFTNYEYYKFFNTIKDSKCIVLLSTRKGPNPESTLRVSFSEMLAYSNINKKLSELGIETSASDSFVEIDKLTSENIFVLGGHFANNITKKYWDKIYNKLPLKLIPQERLLIVGERKYQPKIKNKGRYITTYALVIRINNPFKQNGYIFSSLGLNGFGTLGGVLAILDKKCIKEINKVTQNKNFVAIIKSEVENKNILSYEVKEVYTLYDM